MRLALIQMPVVSDKAENIAVAVERISRQAEQGAELAVLPEMFCSPYDTAQFSAYAEEERGEAQTALSALARKLGIYIVAGSIPEGEGSSLYNTSFVYDPGGRQIARHRKVHLFDIAIEGGQYFRESDVLTSGSDVTVFPTRWGFLGLCICFDIRFADLFRLMALRGARAVIVPGAFNMTTGPAHWELHFRGRAVDNQLFTVGVAPARQEQNSYVSYGHSLVCDPWGRVVHDSGPGDCDHTVSLELAQVDAVRAQLPILSAMRRDVYRLVDVSREKGE